MWHSFEKDCTKLFRVHALVVSVCARKQQFFQLSVAFQGLKKRDLSYPSVWLTFCGSPFLKSVKGTCWQGFEVTDVALLSVNKSIDISF